MRRSMVPKRQPQRLSGCCYVEYQLPKNESGRSKYPLLKTRITLSFGFPIPNSITRAIKIYGA